MTRAFIVVLAALSLISVPTVASADEIATTSGGRVISAKLQGDPEASKVIVAVGQMHGNEPGGRKVIADLRRRSVPEGTALWTIMSLNPDGAARHTRVNGRGVDLNRNFPDRWSTHATYFPGKRAASERETRGMMAFLERVQPDLVVSYHQAYDVIDTAMPRSRPLARAYARFVAMRTATVPCMGPCRGTMIGWLGHHTSIDGFTVELPSQVPSQMANRHARAVLDLFGRLAN